MKYLKSYNQVDEGLKDFFSNPVKSVKDKVAKNKLEKEHKEIEDKFKSEIDMNLLIGKGYIKDLKYSIRSEVNPYDSDVVVTIEVTPKDSLRLDIENEIKKTITDIDVSFGDIKEIKIKLSVRKDEIRMYDFIVTTPMPGFTINNDKVEMTPLSNHVVRTFSVYRSNPYFEYGNFITNLPDRFSQVINYISKDVIDSYKRSIRSLEDNRFVKKVNVDVLNDVFTDIIDISKKHTIDQSGKNAWFVCSFYIDGLVVYSETAHDHPHTFDTAKFRLNDKMIEVMDMLAVAKNRLKDIHKDILVNIDMKNGLLKLSIFGEDITITTKKR